MKELSSALRASSLTMERLLHVEDLVIDSEAHPHSAEDNRQTVKLLLDDVLNNQAVIVQFVATLREKLK